MAIAECADIDEVADDVRKPVERLKNSDLTQVTLLGLTKLIEYVIQLTDETPIRYKHRVHSPKMKEIVLAGIDRLEREGLIED